MNVITAYTDYPVNDTAGVIQVDVLSYDRNKYAKVRYGEHYDEIKSGYLYHDDALTKHFKLRDLLKLPVEIDGPAPTRRQVHVELMKIKRMKKTKYTLCVDDKRHTYYQLRDALKHFGRVFKTTDCMLLRCRKGKLSSTTMPLVSSNGGRLEIPCFANGKTPWKSRYRKVGNF